MNHRILYQSILLTALLAVLTTSCIKNLSETPGQIQAPLSFTAQMGDESTTKTVLASDETSVLWMPNDEINAFYGDVRIGRYTNFSEKETAVAVFEGDGKSFIGATEEEGTAKCYWAIYPYSYKNTSDGSSVSAAIPSFQTAVADNFANGALLTVAKSETTALQFYHVCGGIKFSVTHEGIRQVEFKGNHNEVLAGRVTIKMDVNDRPIVSSVQEGENSITLTAREGVFFKPGKWYYISCLPVDLTEGFTLTLRSDTETGVYVHSDPVIIHRAVWGTLTSVDDSINYQTAANTIEYPAPNEILYTTVLGSPIGIEIIGNDFQDNLQIEDNFYMDGVCHLILNQGITTINRLAPWNSSSHNGLKTISLPEGITKIGDGAFRYNYDLISVSLPASLSELGEFCFSSTGLSSITLPEGLTKIPRGAFSGCDLIDVHLPSSIESIDDYAFSSCSIMSIVLPENCRRIGLKAFASNPLKEITIPDNCEVSYDAFMGCNNLSRFNGNKASADGRCLIEGTTLLAFAPQGLTSYEVPDGVTNLYPNVFYYTSLDELIIPNSVVRMAGYITSSRQTSKLVVKCETPPTFYDTDIYSPSISGIICVPAGSVDTYKAADGWSAFASAIQAIPAAVPEAVDLGLSVKWASFNLGATKPEECGGYYAWGDTSPSDKNLFGWNNYKWCNGTGNSLTKYNTDPECGTVDGKTVLDKDDDAAYQELGGNWRMPTIAEIEELLDGSKCEWNFEPFDEVTGVMGYRITSKIPNYTGNSIFLPIQSYSHDLELDWDLTPGYQMGLYWSSSLDGLYGIGQNLAYLLGFDNRNAPINEPYVGVDYLYRFNRFSIRPVYDDRP